MRAFHQFAAVALGLIALPSMAALITVTEVGDDSSLLGNGECSLREAVRSANSNSAVDGCTAGESATTDTIVFDPSLPGIFVLSIDGAGEDAALSGDLDLVEDVIIQGNGMGGVDQSTATVEEIGTLIVGDDGDDPDSSDDDFADRIFDVQSGVSATFRDLVISRGRSVAEGGGIRAATNSSLTLESVALLQNSVSSNLQNVRGGGVAASGDLTINGAAFLQNTATAVGGGASVTAEGGGLAVSGGEVNLDALVFSQNMLTSQSGTASGGGLSVSGASSFALGDGLFLQNIVFTSGASGAGGGAALAAAGDVARLTLSGNSVAAPGGARGGGLLLSDNVNLSNSTISGNSAAADETNEARGGGLHADGTASVTLNNVTITGNEAQAGTDDTPKGFGGGIDDQTGGETITLSNTLVAGNTASASGPDCAGAPVSNGFNLIGDASGCDITADTGDLFGTEAEPVDPQLAALADNGGSFQVGINTVPQLTHALPRSSAAVDAGSSATPGSGTPSCETTDQRGRGRPLNGDGGGASVCDIGAFERAAPALGGSSGGSGGCLASPPTSPSGGPFDLSLLLLVITALLGLMLRNVETPGPTLQTRGSAAPAK